MANRLRSCTVERANPGAKARDARDADQHQQTGVDRRDDFTANSDIGMGNAL